MIPLPILIELAEFCFAPWGYSAWYPSQAATPQSVARIEAELRIVLPASFVALSQGCPPYGGWFSSIGEDYRSHNHILRANEEFRVPEEGFVVLPPQLVMLNHGHDGDCDCWDTSRPQNADGEYPIVYYSTTSGEIRNDNFIADSFHAYLERRCRTRVKGAKPKWRLKMGEDADAKKLRRERYKVQEARFQRMKSLLAPYEDAT